MSSNLYKQQYTVSNGENKRVINSNSMVAEKLQKLARIAKTTNDTGEEGFKEGLVSFTEELPTIEDLDKKIEEANEEAKKIIENAKKEAERIGQEAIKEAEKQKQNAKDAGYDQGLLEGRQEAEEELEKQRQQLANEAEELENTYQNKLNELEPMLVDVILKVFEKVFHVHFDDKKEILLYLIQNTILNVEGSKEFQIRVCEENYMFLESHKQEILERLGQSITLDIVSDTLLKENQCTIETDSGVFECGLSVQLENLIKALRTLSL